jgi:cysteinyl-tRNA synthetase
MALQLYNTLTRQKQPFVPIDPANVRMYVCGPTVYDFAHIGNARPLIVFDVLFRLLRHLYGEDHVTYVRNITDVDDKINARAAERNISIRELTEETNAAFQADAKALGCLEPTVQPRATEHIKAMITLIERLLLAGHAYVAEGHVLFDVPSMPAYGQLSRRPLDEMVAGARVEVAPYKKSPMDFVLWKPSGANEPGWESPWGTGRPGWHLECSAMSWQYLGEVFDIHGGGIDLVFPHHENEIAQTCSAFGHSVMANVWLHNGFLQVEGQKMSKSLGNFITIREALKDWPGEVLRFNMLKAHYRQPIDWTLASLRESQRELDKFYPLAKQFAVSSATLAPEFLAALEDDLNTPEAITVLRRLYREAHDDVAFAGVRFASSGHFIGLFQSELADWNPAPILFDASRVESLVEARLAARREKNWAESDRLRDELIGMGIAIKDNKDGTTSWEVKR